MRIEWTEPAISDLTALRDYIARDSEDEAIREVLFQSYRILYRLDPGAIRILTVLHGKQDLAGRNPKPWDPR